jgi:hypothetical protein
MKLWPPIFFAILIGAALGAGTALWRIHLAPWDGAPLETGHDPRAPKVAAADEMAPRVSVDREQYEFGNMDAAGELSHAFRFTNSGRSPLVLTKGHTSCRCTVSEIQRGELPPGQSTTVTLHWKAHEVTGEYRQTATILTNDPARPEVTLTVVGQVVVAAWADPAELLLSDIPGDEPASGQVRLLCSQPKKLEVLDYKLSDPELAKFFEVHLEPLAKADLPPRGEVRSGILLKLDVKPGLPQGAFQQTILLRTNLESEPAMSVAVKGTVGSDISVAGDGWNAELGVLSFGIVNSQSGAQRRLILIGRGPHCKELKFKPLEIVPDVLKVTVGETTSLGSEGAATQTPLTVQIPKGSRPANHWGSDQGKLGQIVLETNHPRMPRLRILVRFLIEEE